jgi:hypothetical protein
MTTAAHRADPRGADRWPRRRVFGSDQSARTWVSLRLTDASPNNGPTAQVFGEPAGHPPVAAWPSCLRVTGWSDRRRQEEDASHQHHYDSQVRHSSPAHRLLRVSRPAAKLRRGMAAGPQFTPSLWHLRCRTTSGKAGQHGAQSSISDKDEAAGSSPARPTEPAL